MARDYARIMTAIWKDREFRRLTEAQQRLYLLFVTQPEISAAGLLIARPRHWSDMAADSKPDALLATLDELDQRRFVLVDFGTEELVVRSFIRWDGGATNPKRRPVIIRATEEIDSPRLRAGLNPELARCGLPELDVDMPPDGPGDGVPDRASSGGWTGPDALSDRASDRASDTAYTESRTDMNAESHPQVNRLSDRASDRASPSDGVVGSYVSTREPATHNPQPVPPPAGAATAARDLVAEWINGCTKRPPSDTVGQTGRKIRRLLDDGIDPDDIRAGLALWTAKGLSPSVLPSVVNEIMNARPAQLRIVPDTPALTTVDAYLDHAAGPDAARILGIAYVPDPQPPSDTTAPRDWEREAARRWITHHADALRERLKQLKDTG